MFLFKLHAPDNFIVGGGFFVRFSILPTYNAIVQGKTYSLSDEISRNLYDSVQLKLQGAALRWAVTESDPNRYAESMMRHRIGQGAFRVMVTDAYHRRRAVTGEKTLPVLEAAHIRPYAEKGPHLTSNGILMKSDFHTLFDRGYITIAPDYHIVVSSRLHDDYGNGKDYYKYHGEKLLILPDEKNQLPAAQYLNWHNKNVYPE
ncbi:MAG: HNH endonuclease [Solobacterium sp.]|nr:HNH endonuclease [Solobacterium sp.]